MKAAQKDKRDSNDSSKDGANPSSKTHKDVHVVNGKAYGFCKHCDGLTDHTTGMHSRWAECQRAGNEFKPGRGHALSATVKLHGAGPPLRDRSATPLRRSSGRNSRDDTCSRRSRDNSPARRQTNDGNDSSPERCTFNVTSFRDRLRDYERTSTNPSSAENVHFFKTMFLHLDLN